MARPTTLRLIVAGSRKWPWRQYLFDAISFYTKNYGRSKIEIVEGEAKGPDLWGREWAEEHGVAFKPFPADWDESPRGAGFIRNAKMAEYGNALLAFWDGTSPGTRDMIDKARNAGLRVIVINLLKVREYELQKKTA